MNEYGGFWRRVLAYIIDGIVLAVVLGMIDAVLGIGTTIGQLPGMSASYSYTADDRGSSFLSVALWLVYFAGMESSPMQATLGKKALGMVVTDLSGRRIGFLRGVGRYLAKFLSALILGIGFIMVAFTDRKRGLHDMLAGTLVWKGQPGVTDASIFA